MSVYIRGMEMPKSCRECGCEQGGFWCGLMDEHKDTTCFTDERRDDCPLIPVPDHGRLIDADAAKEILKPIDSLSCYEPEWTWGELYESNCVEIDKLPTIIPADKESGE